MPTKLKDMTSLKIAIIAAIVLIIAVAVGWYLYTTFTASTVGQPRLSVVWATLYTNGTLELYVTNPGPVDVQISQIELADQLQQPQPRLIKVGTTTKVSATFSGDFTAGTMLPSRVILSSGQSFPFNAVVKPYIASTTSQPRLSVVSATLDASDKKLTLRVTNPGPVDVEISQIELAGRIENVNMVIPVGQTHEVTVSFAGTFTPGTLVSGRVILSSGHSFPFTAYVVP